MKFVSCVFVLCCIFFIPVLAQQAENKGVNEEVAIDLPALPPLSVLIDSALARSPQKLILEKQKEESEINLKMTKRELIKGLGISSGYSYGRGGTLGTSENSLTNIPSSIYSANTMSQYHLGVNFGISLGNILDHRSKVRLAKIQISKADDQIRNINDDIAIRIYEEYTKLQMNMETLRNMAMLCDSYRAQLVLTEKDYLNNRVQLSQLTAARESYTRTLLDIEKQKRECRLSVFSLERITGVSFSK